MKTKFNGIFTLLLALAVQVSFAQERTISGTVSDETGPLPGVSVLKKGTVQGTETDFDGKYTIKAKTGDILVFSFVGMETVEKAVGTSNKMNVSMKSGNILEEIIVTGQGSGMKKKRMSTTVDVVKAKDIEKLPSTQIDQILQSTTPSAQIRLSSGQPGTAALIRTRGPISASSSATPVLIVDGVRVDNLNSNSELGIDTGGANVSSLADIPVESIEKIEYIKGGAATTLYGADAANGVIQIITKKGKEGSSNIFLETRLGIIKATTDFLKYERTSEALFDTGLVQSYKFGLNGGKEGITYNFSAGLYRDDSFNDYNKQIKRNVGFGTSAKLSEKLKYQGSFSYVGFEANTDYNANSGFSRFSGLEGGKFGDLTKMNSNDWSELKSLMKEQGELTDISRYAHRLTNSNKFTYDIVENIQANITIGIDSRVSRSQILESNALLVSMGSRPEGSTDKAYMYRSIRRNFTTTGDLNLTHNIDLKNFSFVTILGGQFFRSNDRQEAIEGSGGVDGTVSISTFPTKNAYDFVSERGNYGFYILENIGIYDIAYIEFGGRYDENTSAGKNAKAKFLPKVGITYNITDHDFYSDSLKETLSNIRLRANYGQATNFAEAFREDKTFALNTFLGKPSFTFNNPGNPELDSELVTTYEVGLDLGFFNNRLNFSTTYYNGITEDALFTPRQTQSSGQLAQVKNLGEIENTGWEFSLTADLIRNENHTLSINGSYNKNKNVVISTGGAPSFRVGGFNVIGSYVDEGESLGFLRGTSAKKVNGIWEFTPNSFLGDTYAPNFGSFGFNYTYKGKLNLFMSGDYQFGGKSVDLSFLLRHLRGVDNTGIPEELVKLKEADQVSPFSYVNYVSFESDFVKIRNIGVSYNFGKILKGLKGASLGFSVSNPFNWTKASFDPETSGSGIGTQNGFASGGFAYGTESAPRIYMTSVKFQF